MSVRILFADDSVTAQNMGKRILTEAGYEVVAVSNGAAAVKKIAEQKPDIIILDLYMPGYSGLEVCEKVRGSMATLKTPVLLTVGKMEPYRAEDANRVRADGVIVKPFEASDLLAIVKKFEERLASSQPLIEQTVAERPEEAATDEPELVIEHPEPPTGGARQAAPVVDVPDHMASSSAFSDLLVSDASEPIPFVAESSQNHEPQAAASSPRSAVPEYELPVSWKEQEIERTEVELPAPPAPEPETPEFHPMAVEPPAQAPAADIPAPAPAAASHPLQIPVYQEPVDTFEQHEVIPTSAAPVTEIEIPRDPFLEETAAEITRNTTAENVEPGLMPGMQHQPQDILPVEMAAAAKPETHEVEMSSPQIVAVPETETAAKSSSNFSDADFEARVAAAMAAYGHQDSGAAGVIEIEPAVQDTEPIASAPEVMAQPAEASPQLEQPVPTFEYQPPIAISAPEPMPIEATPPAAMAAAGAEKGVIAQAPPAHVSASQSEGAEPLSIGAEADAEKAVEAAAQTLAAAAAETGADRDTIAQAVHRVMERLKPELVDEILRELKSK